MQKISVVIICKDEEAEIGRCIQSVEGLTDDIVVLDNGSTDGTKAIVRQMGCRLVEESWEGFGRTKNKATEFAKYDWVLNLDADESVDEQLKTSLMQLPLDRENEVFEIKFRNFFGEKYLRFGEWGWDKHVRVFNRNKVNWSEAKVHEGLVLSSDIKKTRLPGYILHYTVANVTEFADKVFKYALLSAEKYAEQRRRSSWFKINIAPAFDFLRYYVFKLGFLDGEKGFICAKMTSYYTFLKYARLLELNEQAKKNDQE